MSRPPVLEMCWFPKGNTTPSVPDAVAGVLRNTFFFTHATSIQQKAIPVFLRPATGQGSTDGPNRFGPLLGGTKERGRVGVILEMNRHLSGVQATVFWEDLNETLHEIFCIIFLNTAAHVQSWCRAGAQLSYNFKLFLRRANNPPIKVHPGP